MLIIFGLLIGNIFHINNFLLEGIKFSLKFILRLGIICLGIRLGLLDIFKVGIVGIPLIVACIIISILVVNYLCKLLNVSSKMGSLIAVGTSICGASAIVATSPAINADKEEVASKKAGNNESWRWISDGQSGFEIKKDAISYGINIKF